MVHRHHVMPVTFFESKYNMFNSNQEVSNADRIIRVDCQAVAVERNAVTELGCDEHADGSHQLQPVLCDVHREDNVVEIYCG